ncbi:hypothetical protein OUZ56_003018 [Daphnia magna]|uniref:Uncharacterized protein n=1 Tax=Daphnia magna TaxID=35525 RepID=A0ABR0A7H2_9CRUS|nr:hypothetical protein OUZ56_003018 [Daphnia magna]
MFCVLIATYLGHLRTLNSNKMYPPWPLPGIHCSGHFDDAHYLLNLKMYFPTWMENAANTLNANLKLWLSNTILKIQTQIQLTLKPNHKKKTKTINVNNDNMAKQSNKIGTPATETMLNA